MTTLHSNTVGSSSAARVIACPRSYTLSKDVPNEESEYAAEGSMLHEACERILNDEFENQEDVIGLETRWGAVTKDLYQEMIVPAVSAFDKLFDERFEFFLEKTVNFPGIPDSFGTADVIGQTDEYTAILDWKFGRGVEVDAEDNKQLLFCASAARHDYPNMFKHNKIFGIIVQPGFDHEPKVWQFTHAEVDEFEKDLIAAWACVEDTNVPLREGSHCTFCPAKALCPAKHEKIRKVQMLAKEAAEGKPSNEHMPSRDLAVLLPLAEEALEWANAVKKLAHAELERGTVIAGWKLVQKRATRKWEDEAEAAKKLRNMRMTKVDMYPVKLISPAQAEKWMKANTSSKRAKTIRTAKLEELITSHSSGTTLVPADDPREAVGDTTSKLEKLKGIKA